jgi:predicted secreted acid phosphatase
MKPIVIIDSFFSIQFDDTKKPIVICDIDHTFLRPKYSYNEYYNQMNKNNYNFLDIHNAIKRLLEVSMETGNIKQSDPNGFAYMIQKTKELNGKLIFLTARTKFVHNRTVEDLQKVGLNTAEEYEIHYTNNEVSKAEYIKQNQLLRGYNHWIFIDDRVDWLSGALHLYPSMDCYLFKYK